MPYSDQKDELCINQQTIIFGDILTELPQDLYIPPKALRIFLETFTGPLDLLLYLIRKQNLNILDIPIAKIAMQYVEYIDLMKEAHLELAIEYLVMAAMLAEIKSRLLLPKPENSENLEEDPRAELVRRLQEYEYYKKLAEEIDDLPRLEREIFPANAKVELTNQLPVSLPEIKLENLINAIQKLLAKTKLFEKHQIQGEALSIREKMSNILIQLKNKNFTTFQDLLNFQEGRMGIVITFIAMLELLKQSVIEIVQSEAFGQIHIKLAQETKD